VFARLRQVEHLLDGAALLLYLPWSIMRA